MTTIKSPKFTEVAFSLGKFNKAAVQEPEWAVTSIHPDLSELLKRSDCLGDLL